jgi:hypothetical protein
MIFRRLVGGQNSASPQNAADTPQNDPAEKLAAYLRESKLSLSEARKYARDKLLRTNGEKVLKSIRANLSKYGLKLEKDPEHPAKKRFAPAQ